MATILDNETKDGERAEIVNGYTLQQLERSPHFHV